MPRWIVINEDGTWNGRSDISPTNVLLFHNACVDAGHVSLYFAGPGDEDENGFFGHLMGGAFGAGCQEICDNSLAAFKAVYQEGDRIAFSAFSRGGSNARSIASTLAKQGYDIDTLFIWETVHAQLPIGRWQQTSLFRDLHVSPKVKRAFHALSLDEDRDAFAPNLMEPRDGITQMVFRGNHADVGGGYQKRGFADISLHWMAENARSGGLEIDPASLPELGSSPSVLHREDWKGSRSKRVFPPHVEFYDGMTRAE